MIKQLKVPRDHVDRSVSTPRVYFLFGTCAQDMINPQAPSDLDYRTTMNDDLDQSKGSRWGCASWDEQGTGVDDRQSRPHQLLEWPAGRSLFVVSAGLDAASSYYIVCNEHLVLCMEQRAARQFGMALAYRDAYGCMLTTPGVFLLVSSVA
ncbi:hypothetical protein HJFPF1_10020 [Paramyrothecium foliicola]|nr:hypothetical protein HJFPF1_10020 [Paramyrothecium foliicola]